MSTTNYTALLELMIDKSSLTKIQKQLAKEKFRINAEVNVNGAEKIIELSGSLAKLIDTAAFVSQALQSFQEFNTAFMDIGKSIGYSSTEIKTATSEINNQIKAWEQLSSAMNKAVPSSGVAASSSASNSKSLATHLSGALNSFVSSISTLSDLNDAAKIINDNLAQL